MTRFEGLRKQQAEQAARERRDPEYARRLMAEWINRPTKKRRGAKHQEWIKAQEQSRLEAKKRGAQGRRIRKARIRAAKELEFCRSVDTSGFRSMRYVDYLQTPYWRAVRTIKLIEANHQCEKCPSTRFLQVHHLSYDCRGREHEALMMLKVLCETCHKREHGLA